MNGISIALAIHSLEGISIAFAIRSVDPTTSRENEHPHRARQKKQKRASKFTALDPRNQWTKQFR